MSNAWIYIGLFFAALAGMELVAYLTHRFLMHGPLWFLHESHHRPREGWFEWKVVAPWANGGICNDVLTRCECATSYVFFTSADGTLIVSSVASTPYDGGDCTGYPAAP